MSNPQSESSASRPTRAAHERTWARRPQLSRAAAAVLRNAGMLARDALRSWVAKRVPRDWLVVRLDQGLGEAEASSRWARSLRSSPPSLAATLDALDRCRADPRVKGVFLRLGTAPLGWAKLHALVEAVDALRAAEEKHVVVYGAHVGNAAACLGSLASQFWLAPPGRIDLVGLRIESPFVRRLLDRWSIKPLVLTAGRYKSAAELLEREAMSEASREALEAVLEDLYRLLEDAVARRAGSTKTAQEWIDGGPYLASQALELGLIDRVLYPDELPGALAALGRYRPGEDPSSENPSSAAASPEGESTAPQNLTAEAPADANSPHTISMSTYLRVTAPRFRWHPVLSHRPLVVVAPLLGTIDLELARLVSGWLSELRDRPEVAAVVLRIDSPGGDPAASDLIWRSVTRCRESKPVVASMGDTAASGGYYAAMAADEMWAAPTSLTGSIGVVMAGVEVSGGLDRLGVGFDGVQRGRHAGLFSPVHEHSDEERALLSRQVQLLYEDFVAKAAANRGMSADAFEPLAQGRVWSGAAAHVRSLIDGVGGLREALERARSLAGVAPEECDVVWLEPAPSPLRRWLARSRDDDPFDVCTGPSAPGNLSGRPLLWCPVRVAMDE